jgi:lanosterol synthase
MHALVDIPDSGEIPFTDYSLWRLEADEGGRHVWKYLSEEEALKCPQNSMEKYWLGLPTVSPEFYLAKWH